jgi:hypothetical protein
MARRQSRYEAAVQWIADNDETAADAATMRDLISVVLVADVFDTTTEAVVRDVMACRQALWEVVREISR